MVACAWRLRRLHAVEAGVFQGERDDDIWGPHGALGYAFHQATETFAKLARYDAGRAGDAACRTGLRLHHTLRALPRHQPSAGARLVPDAQGAGLRRRTMYQTRHSFASNALEAGEPPSWVAAMLGHATPEMLFQVYARFIPNRTRRDGAALLARMGCDTGHDATREEAPESGRRTPDLLPHDDRPAQEPLRLKGFRRGRCERGALNPHGCLAHRILNPARLPIPPLSPAGGHSGKSLSAQGFRRGAVDGVSGRMVCRAPYLAWATEGSDHRRRR